MLISDVFTNPGRSTPVDRLRQRAVCDPRCPGELHPAEPCYEIRRETEFIPSPGRVIAADWWPLLAAGIAIALLA